MEESAKQKPEAKMSPQVRLLLAGQRGRERNRSATSARLRAKPITLPPLKFLETEVEE